MRISRFFWAILMACFAGTAAAETVYKWIDGAGQVHYTDLPPSRSDAKVIGIYEQESGVVEEGDFGDFAEEGEGDEPGDETTPPPDEATPGTPPEPPISQAAMAASLADTAKAQAEQCKEAQERYKRYTESRRLFRQLPNGEREYLTDKELTEARARARQTVTEYCN